MFNTWWANARVAEFQAKWITVHHYNTRFKRDLNASLGFMIYRVIQIKRDYFSSQQKLLWRSNLLVASFPSQISVRNFVWNSFWSKKCFSWSHRIMLRFCQKLWFFAYMRLILCPCVAYEKNFEFFLCYIR